MNRLEIQTKYDKILKQFFMLGFVILIILRMCQYSQFLAIPKGIKSLFRMISLVLMLPNVCLQKYSKKNITIVILLYGISIVCILFGGDKSILLIPTALIGTKDFDIKRIVKLILIINCTLLLIHFIAFVCNYLIEGNKIVNIFSYMWTSFYNNLMFSSRNTFAIYSLFAVIAYIYCTDLSIYRNIKIVICLSFIVFVYLISNSRTCFILSLLSLLYVLLEKNKYFISKIKNISIIIIAISFLFTLLMLFIGKRINNPFFEKIDVFLGWRPRYLYKMVEYVGINALPEIGKFNNIKEYFGNNIVVFPDNSYIATILKWGIIITLLFCYISYLVIYSNENEPIIYYFICIIAILFSLEYITYEFIINVLPLIIFNNYFKKNSL